MRNFINAEEDEEDGEESGKEEKEEQKDNKNNEDTVYHEIVMIMHVYHALINALSSHMIHMNLNTIFCPHEEKCPTNAVYM